MEGVKYEKDLDGAAQLTITESNVATYTDCTDPDGPRAVSVQLANDTEAQQMIAEFEDPEGELMNQEGAIFQKYEELQQFCP